MWGESSKNCENNCQCSGLITENFKINSGNNATKRKQEAAHSNNYKLNMNPHSLNFTSPNNSPKATPSKRRILGELQNFKVSPVINRLKNSPVPVKSPTPISPLALASPLLNSPIIATHSPITSRFRTSKISRIFEERTLFKMENKENCSYKENDCSYKENENCSYKENANCSYKENENSSYKENDCSYKENQNCSYKESENSSYKENYVECLKFELEETRDFSFGERFQAGREREQNWSSTKLDFTDAIPPKHDLVPEQTQDLDDLESLQDLEAEFDNESFEQCTKYEIISTDSPNVISRGRSTSRKVCSRNFEFGAPLADSEPSTSFNRPATRMLNFDEEDFEFTSPAVKKTISVKKSLKFSETERSESRERSETRSLFDTTDSNTSRSELVTRTLFERSDSMPSRTLTHERSDSSIGSMSSSPKLPRIFTSESTTSMESGFISEMDEPFLEIEESNSPKIANFNDLLSGQIKENVVTGGFLKRPMARSLSFHPESKAKPLLRVLESSEEKRKREEECSSSFGQGNKRRRSNCEVLERIQRPVLQRAFSENNASIKSALARSSMNSDLIGDYSGGYTLPLTSGDHDDLKSISCDTLAALLRGEYYGAVPHYQVIDCRYPYEFDGGHIESAVNVFTCEQIQALVQSAPAGKTVLIFHCEFSIERGPKLSRTLRSFDRSHNRARYPSLAYPELYILHGGYRAFHNAHPNLCTPGGYTPMLDPQHKHLLRRHRSLQGKNRLLL